MKNLKRLLCLALTGVMLSGMMVMGANAAFPDADEIVNTEAVNTMVSLSIINGKDDGAFHPTDNVTRAEMAKMIATAVNGGVAPEFGVKTVPTFTDIKGHWAEQFIEYCADLKYINGRGNGTFDPNGNVTGIEAAKMVLTALGYDAEAYQLVGADWAINVSAIASRTCRPISLYEGLNGTNLNVAATRDTAAQLLWNGLQNYTVEFSPNLTIVGTGLSYGYEQTKETLLERAYDAEIKYGIINGFEYDSDTEEFTYTIGTAAGVDSDDQYTGTVTTEKDLTDLFKQQVQIVYKPKAKSNKIDTLYGVSAYNSTVLGTELLGDLPDIADGKSTEPDDEKIKINGTTYRVDHELQDLDVVEFLYGEATGEIDADITLDELDTEDIEHYTMDIIDQDGDGKADIVVVHPITVAKVGAVGKSSISVAGKSYQFDKCDIYDDPARDDWAVVTLAANTAKGVAKIEQAEIVTETIDALRDGNKSVRINGTWYADKTSVGWTLNEEYDLVIVNGYIFSGEAVEDAIDVANIVYITAYEGKGEGSEGDKAKGKNEQKVDLIFSNGKEETDVTVVKLDEKKIGEDNTYIDDTAASKLYTYSVDKNNKYTLKPIDEEKYDEAETGSVTINSGKTASKKLRFNDDAVLFVNTDDGVEIISGADVNAWGNKNYTSTGTELYAKQNSTNFKYVVVGLLNMSKVPGASGNTAYGYITAKSSRVKSGSTYYISMTLWDGEDEITVRAESTKTASTVNNVQSNTSPDTYKVGTFIQYKNLGDDKIGEVEIVDLAYAAVEAYDGKWISFADGDNTAYEVNKDTKIFYVDTGKSGGPEGAEVGEILVANFEVDEEGNKTYTKNVGYVLNDDEDAIAVIVVDTDQKIKIPN